MKIITDKIDRKELVEIAKDQFGDMVKAVVDVDKKIMVIGGELHADEEALLLEQGSEQKNLWGINIYVDKSKEDWIEFNSMINIRPAQGNRSRDVENENVRKKIQDIVALLIVY